MLIRYYGHVGVPSGYGHAANEICMAMLSAGLDLEISTDGETLHNDYLPLARCLRDEAALSPHPDVIIVHTLPVDCGHHLERLYLRERTGARCIAYTTWEGTSAIPPPVAASLLWFDEIWVPSTATQLTIVPFDGATDTISPVRVVPHPFDEDLIEDCPKCGSFHRKDLFHAGHQVSTPADVGDVVSNHGEDGHVRVAFDEECESVESFAPCELSHPSEVYRFYYVGAWSARKNVEGVIRAYLRAFGKDDPVELVIHSALAGGNACQVAALATGIAPEAAPPIVFTNDRESPGYVRDLHARGHCFVTAARGEAWNLPCFDAMLWRNHIIAPRGLGSDDFLADTDADLYNATIVPAWGDIRLVTKPDTPAGHAVAQYMATQGMTVGSDWWDPDIAQLAIRMRAAFHHDKRRLRVDYHPATRFGRRAVGAQIHALLEGSTR